MIRSRAGRIWLPLGFLAVAGFAVVAALSIRLPLTSEVQPYFTNPLVPAIQGSVSVGQSFIASYPDLNSIGVLVGTNARANRAPLVFDLRDAATDAVLSSETIDPSGLSDNTFVDVAFPVQTESRGHAYRFTLAAPQASANDGITVWANRNETLAQGRAYISGAPTDEELAFRAGYHVTVAEIFSAILARLVAGRPGIWGSPATYFLLLAGYVVVGWLGIRRLAQRLREIRT